MSRSRAKGTGRLCACGCGGRPALATAEYIRGHRPPTPPIERFWPKVDKDGPNGCWLWTAYRTPSGYGQFGVDSRNIVSAHRYSFELVCGPIPAGMFVCHRCDNPPCVNPDHLFLGTPADNASDMARKGRGRGVTGLAHYNGRLTSEQVEDIRALYRAGTPGQRIADQFGITPQYVSQLARRIWRKSA